MVSSINGNPSQANPKLIYKKKLNTARGEHKDDVAKRIRSIIQRDTTRNN